MQFESNSNKSKSEKPVEKKQVSKIVTSKVRTKKKSELKKFTDVFISEDVDSVKNYILVDVLVPAVKTAIVDIVKNGIDMLLWGETTPHKSKGVSSKINYRGFYDSNNHRAERQPLKARNTFDYDDIIFETKGEAENVLMTMDELIVSYSIATVADLYDLCGISDVPFTANRYGWTDLRTASVVRIREGYYIKMPKAMPID